MRRALRMRIQNAVEFFRVPVAEFVLPEAYAYTGRRCSRQFQLLESLGLASSCNPVRLQMPQFHNAAELISIPEALLSGCDSDV